ncbi:MAG: hypothetical protein M0Z75_07055 [Nitrospiraceae bacterium]|nr:hypothetical protein [Nitrospiraceae bacterium]
MLEEIAKKYGMTEASLRFLIRRGVIQIDPAGRTWMYFRPWDKYGRTWPG